MSDTIREKLARVVIAKMDCATRLDDRPCMPNYPQGCGCAAAVVYAVLSELKDVSLNDLCEVGRRAADEHTGEEMTPSGLAVAWRAMIQHIMEGGS